MTEQSREERLAALRQRRGGPAAPPEPTRAAGIVTGPRLVASGASVVSFAAMVVAMGPLTAQAETAEPVASHDDDHGGPLLIEPPAPSVVIEVIPNYVTPDGVPTQAPAVAAVPATTTTIAGQLPAPESLPSETSTERVAALPTGAVTAPSTDVPTTEAVPTPASAVATNGATPATSPVGEVAGTVAPTTTVLTGADPAPTAAQSPVPTAAPTTAVAATVPVTTAPPATLPPTTAAPITIPITVAPPPTQPPATAPPPTAPPKSEGS